MEEVFDGNGDETNSQCTDIYDGNETFGMVLTDSKL